MKLYATSLIKTFFRFRYPVSLIEPAYFWISAPRFLKWILAIRPFSLVVFEVPFLRNMFFKKSVNERIVENAFVLSQISNVPSDILDFGTTSSWISLQLTSLGHKVKGIDLRPYEFSHPNLNFTQGDVFKIILPENYFDFVLIVSTLEHVKTEEDGADKKAIKILSICLKRGGKMIITVPYGRPVTLSSHRVYSKNRINGIIPEGLFIKEAKYFKKESDTVWMPSKEEEIAEADSSKISNGLYCLILEKK